MAHRVTLIPGDASGRKFVQRFCASSRRPAPGSNGSGSSSAVTLKTWRVHVLGKREKVTRDLGGKASTTEFTDAITAEL